MNSTLQGRWGHDPAPTPAGSEGAGGGGRTHMMNMAMGTMTLSRMRKPQKMKKVSAAARAHLMWGVLLFIGAWGKTPPSGLSSPRSTGTPQPPAS